MKFVYYVNCSLCMIIVNFWKNLLSCRLGRVLIRLVVFLGLVVVVYFLRVFFFG